MQWLSQNEASLIVIVLLTAVLLAFLTFFVIKKNSKVRNEKSADNLEEDREFQILQEILLVSFDCEQI